MAAVAASPADLLSPSTPATPGPSSATLLPPPGQAITGLSLRNGGEPGRQAAGHADAVSAAPGDGPSREPLPAEASVGRYDERPRLSGPHTPGGDTDLEGTGTATTPPPVASGEKTKARDIIAAIRTLQEVEREHRPATPAERQTLARFGGFGAVALSLFPNPATGRYRDAGWQALGDELKSLLTPEEYDSARRTVFSQYFTSPVVMQAMHRAIRRLGVPDDATVLEPGCGTGNFMSQAPAGMRFIGVELDSISGRIARVLHPTADIRIEGFQDSQLPPVDAVIGNPPFGDVDIKYAGEKRPLHDFFFAKSVDVMKPGGILALVTSRFTLDKQNAATREYLASRADFLGAIRLPSDAFRREGTDVVTDILFLRKRESGQTAKHADPDCRATAS